MLQRFIQHFADMRTMSRLAQAAERHANAMGEQEPGAEHFLLAALDLDDGLAQRAFVRVGADPSQLRAGILAGHGAALAGIGAGNALVADDGGVPQRKGVYQAKGSVEPVMRALADWPRAPGEPLTSARVVAVIAAIPHGTAARALKALGIDAAALVAAARGEIDGAARQAA